MKQEIAKLWCDALRSGKYQQGFATLRPFTEDGQKYCCLGVLSHLHLGDGSWPVSNSGSLIASEVIEWAGIDKNNPMACSFGTDDEPTLANRNDGFVLPEDKKEYWNFNQIADYIEENWEKL